MPQALKEKVLRLNLGSRNRSMRKLGFTNVDIDAHKDVDIVADVKNLYSVEDRSVQEIYASHILEHFPHTETLSVLEEWNRVLKPGGTLYVAVPDFKRTVEIYTKAGSGLCDWVQNFLMGDQIYETAFHYALFDFDRLAALLQGAGFSNPKQVAQFPFKGDDCSKRVSTWDRKSVSLNVIARKYQ